MMQLFDKQVQVRTGQANVRAWTDELLGMLTDDDPFGVDSFATHHLPLEDAPSAYEHFQKKEEGMVKLCSDPDPGPDGGERPRRLTRLRRSSRSGPSWRSPACGRDSAPRTRP